MNDKDVAAGVWRIEAVGLPLVFNVMKGNDCCDASPSAVKSWSTFPRPEVVLRVKEQFRSSCAKQKPAESELSHPDGEMNRILL